ncbi:MAG: site-specific integrase [Chloroflexi bacterium]|nr:site-specific integrase [Chloroflexota bacterium]
MASYPRRRSYGSGSVYRAADGRWRGAAVTIDPATGKRTRRTVSGPTAADTRRKLDALRAAGIPSTTMRTADWLAAWLPTTRLRVAPSTFRGYETVTRAISDRIGDVPLGKLIPSDVERMTAAMVADGRTARTAGMARKVLRLALRQAIRDELVVRNVAAEARPPKVARFDAQTLTAAEAQRLIAASAEDELGPLWAVLLATGLRQGEALGLAWADVDFTAGTLTVRHALARGWDGKPTLGPPKSERSRRTIALPGAARIALERQRIRQGAARNAAGTAWQDRDGLVFTDAVGRPLVGRYITPALRTALKRAALPAIRCHDLRHTAATLQLAGGVPLAVISRTLGHSTIAVTADIYAAVTPDLRREAADAMDRALGSES